MRLLTPKEASEMLRISRKTLYRWLHAGVLPYHKLGKTIRIKQEDVQALIERSCITANVREIVEDVIKKIL